MLKSIIITTGLLFTAVGFSNPFQNYLGSYKVINKTCLENDKPAECETLSNEQVLVSVDTNTTLIRISTEPFLKLEELNRPEMNEQAYYVTNTRGSHRARWEYKRLLGDRYGHMSVDKRFVEIKEIAGSELCELSVFHQMEDVSNNIESSLQSFILEKN